MNGMSLRDIRRRVVRLKGLKYKCKKIKLKSIGNHGNY